MKHNMFILIPAGILTAVLLLTGICFAAAYISPGQPIEDTDITEEFIPDENISVSFAGIGTFDAELSNYNESDNGRISVEYKDDNGNFFYGNENEIRSAHFNIAGFARSAALSEDELLGIARTIIADRCDFSRYSTVKHRITNSGYHEFNFYCMVNGIQVTGHYTVVLRNDGAPVRIFAPSGFTMDEFDLSLAEDVTMDDILDFCEREIEGEYVYLDSRITIADGVYAIRILCDRPDGTAIDLVYPLV